MSEIILPLKNALSTAKIYGFNVIPVNGVLEFGICTCGNKDCKSPGKHPVGNEWQKRATKDPEKIQQLFAGLSDAYNYGIATGAESGIFIVDIDGAEGEKSLEELQLVHGKLPETLTAISGNGRHLFFIHPGKRVSGNSNKIAPKVDIRGDGNQVVGAGSTHSSGRKYEWWHPLMPIAQAPDWLIEAVTRDNKPDRTPLNITRDVSEFKTRLHIAENFSASDIQEMLGYINPDSCYDDWYQVGMALKDYGMPLSMWDDWSKKGSKYVANEPGHKWNSFRNSGVTIGTVVHFAKQGGWRPVNNNRVALNAINNASKSASPEIAQKRPKTPIDEFDTETGEVFEEEFTDKRSDKSDEILDETNNNFISENNTFIDDKIIFEGRKLPLLYASDIKPVLHTNDFVEGLLSENQFSVIYGASNCGKTFFMLDLAMHIALGRRWRDREVQGGGVLYAALEGGNGTNNRISAFMQHFNIEQAPNLVVVPNNLNFMDAQGDIMSLIYAIKEAQQRIGNIKLIVIDTLARAISGGDENSSQDMGTMIINADMIRAVTGAHISFIHHSGKDDLKGARGHSSLRAAVDTEIEISRVDEHSPSRVRVVKQREMEMMEESYFKLERVVLGENNRGKEVSSCVAISVAEAPIAKKAKLTAIQQFVYDAIVQGIYDTGTMRSVVKDMPSVKCISYDEMKDVLEARGYKEIMATEQKSSAQQIKSATQSARVALKKHGKINFNGIYIWLTENEGM